MDKSFAKKMREAISIADMFEIVKEMVWKVLRKSRAG
jgi:hypothetical protein